MMRQSAGRVAIVLAVLAVLPAAARAADTFEVDPVHSTAIFRVKHLGVSFVYGRFTDVAGTVVVDAADLEKSSMSVTVKVGSVNTDNAKRDEHLRGPEFFNVKEFPTATFQSTAFKKTGDDEYDVTGKFTLHGVTKTIVVPVKNTGAGKDGAGNLRTGGESVFTIKRSDYGVSALPQGIGDEVTIMVSLEGVLKK
jgi:polyisoprenoid-binding protein YceI